MSFVTREELAAMNLIRQDQLEPMVRQLIGEQQATFNAIRVDIQETVSKVTGIDAKASEAQSAFDIKYAAAMASIDTKVSAMEESQAKLLEHLARENDKLKKEQENQELFNETTRASTDRSFNELEKRLQDYTVQQEAMVQSNLGETLKAAEERIHNSMMSIMAGARQEFAQGGFPTSGKGAGARGDRSAFDPRDYKLHDLGDTPTLAASRK